jgi:hypothetical protein
MMSSQGPTVPATAVLSAAVVVCGMRWFPEWAVQLHGMAADTISNTGILLLVEAAGMQEAGGLSRLAPATSAAAIPLTGDGQLVSVMTLEQGFNSRACDELYISKISFILDALVQPLHSVLPED